MFKSILNEKTRFALEVFLKKPSHALLLSGNSNSELDEIAEELAKKIAQGNIFRLAPKIHNKQKTENINFDDIASIRQLLRNKQKQALVILISRAEKMTTRAPEALLKLLEEPGDNIYFILTTIQASKMPQTILSRTQIINILPISEEQSTNLINQIKDPRRRSQIHFLAKNLPGEITKLSSDEEYFRQKAHFLQTAKNFLSGDIYERLKLVSKMNKRDDALAFLDSLSQITFHLDSSKIKAKNIEIISEVSDNIATNGNLRAQLTFLVLSMV